MSKFPEPINLPSNVYQARAQRYEQIVNCAKWGIKARLAIILFEVIGFVYTNSSALFVDVAASMVDVISTIFLIVCVQLARKPPDKDHPFGHGRYEPLGGLLLGILLGVMGITFFIQQLMGTIQEEHTGNMSFWAWVFPAAAVLLLEICYRYVMGIAKKENSPALVTDAYHYRIDALTSLLATITLIIAAYLPAWSLFIDHMGAIFISLLMIGLGFYGAKENFHQLMDKTPDEQFFNTVKQAAEKVEGVFETEKILIQLYGPDAHVDIDVEVDPQLTVDLAHKISQKVRAEIQKAWPAVRDVTVHIEPFYPNDH